MIYNPRDWYWLVGQAPTQVWSSAALRYVEFSNAAYLAWSAAGNHATRIPDEIDLMQVHQQQVVPHVISRGFVVTAPAALRGTYGLTDADRTLMTNLAVSLAAGRPVPGGGDKFNFTDSNGVSHSFTKDQFLALANACDNYLYNWQQALSSNINGKGGNYPSNTIKL